MKIPAKPPSLQTLYESALEKGGRSRYMEIITRPIGPAPSTIRCAASVANALAWEKDNGAERVTLESAMAKAFATEAAQRIVDDAVQILGGRGVLADHPVDQLYRSVRSLRIYEGATEIQQLIIAAQVLKEYRERETR